ncbi:hypothetical protein HGP17_10750 [Rhizobium sp. P38BS-XIX]|uniref:hypothetical protein n=1 Tax=Rhizobium sp. P38BS-XIX TaxID=2726740 RepID=UPI001456C9B0|nr:hypothetical protein [Rhizobium sp. P38BS-XIX]NLR97308.1 hypothetical protein [Rhizobium sp. P38BS-XIX]
MNDDFRLKLIKIREEKIAHLDELLEMKIRATSKKEVKGSIDIDGMIIHEQIAIASLSDAIARLT